MQQASRVKYFFYEKENLPLERNEFVNPPKKKDTLRVAYKFFFGARKSLDNNFFDTLKIRTLSPV
jgi:hypothetical protein